MSARPAHETASRLAPPARLAPTLLVLALCLPAGRADAWVRTTTCASVCFDSCETAENGVCEDGGDGSAGDSCDAGTDCADCGYRPAPSTSGFRCRDGEIPVPIRWPVRCAGYHINDAGVTEISEFLTLVDVINASFEAWSEVECSYFEMVYAGETDEARPGYSTCDDNVNFVGFVEQGWNQLGYPSQALALTSVTFDIRDGLIVDADIEMNAANFTFGRVAEAGAVGSVQDLQNTLTHEVGHFVGLDHTRAPSHVGSGTFEDATMADSSPPGEVSKRDLHADDVAGICAIYPVEDVDQAGPCQIDNEGYVNAPTFGPGEECTDEPMTGGGGDGCCSSAAGRPPSLLTLLIALVLVRRRRR